MIHILQDNENIDGSPFSVRVYDPARVRVFGLQDAGETGGPVQFSGQSANLSSYPGVSVGFSRPRPVGLIFEAKATK